MDMKRKRFASKTAGSSTSTSASTITSTADDVSIPLIPIIRKSEIAKVLPKYASVLVEGTITMDDLDPLQRDLEKLLSICSVRNQTLRSEEKRRDKKGKQHAKTSLKRKRPDPVDAEKPKPRKSGSRRVKQNSLPVNNLLTDQLRDEVEVPKMNLLKNDTSDQFWSSIETYCADLTKDDVAFLDNIIQECTKEIDVKIPKLGAHYTQEWTGEILNEEQPLGGSQKSKASALSSPITQRLLALVAEQKGSSFDLSGSTSTNKAGICMERRFQKELIEQGILSVDDLSETTREDEILKEIRKCQQELATVNEYNLEELNKLRSVAVKELRRSKIKDALSKADSEVLDIYKKLLSSKQKHVQSEGDKILFTITTRPVKDVESQAVAVIGQQSMLRKEITELADADVPVPN